MQTSSVLIVIFAMPTPCCVPECNQNGVKSPTGEKVSFFEFPNQSLLRKRWIHAIRRDEGKNWQITRDTKVCSLHFRREDLRKSLAGRTYLVDGCVSSRFAWSIPSPRKRKAPTERLPLPIPLSHVQPFVTTKTSGKSRGLTSLDFAQLGPVRPSGPPEWSAIFAFGVLKYQAVTMTLKHRNPTDSRRLPCCHHSFFNLSPNKLANYGVRST